MEPRKDTTTPFAASTDAENAPRVNPSHAPLDLSEAEELCHTLKRISVRSEQALHKGDAVNDLAQLERWVESYRRGLAAAEKIATGGVDMLKKTREKLALSLEERLRLTDDGGPTPTPEQAAETDEIARALRHIDALLPSLEQSFQSTQAAPVAA